MKEREAKLLPVGTVVHHGGNDEDYVLTCFNESGFPRWCPVVAWRAGSKRAIHLNVSQLTPTGEKL